MVPDVAAFGKVRGRRLPPRRGRRAGGTSCGTSRRARRQPEFVRRRARSTATRSLPRPASPPWPSCGSPGRTRASSRPGPGSRRGWRPRPEARACPPRWRASRPCSRSIFTDRPITDYRATLAADRALHAAFTREMLERGVVKAAGKFYVSLAHTDGRRRPHDRDLRRGAQGGRGTATPINRRGGLPMAENWTTKRGRRNSGTAARSRGAGSSAWARRRRARSAPRCWCPPRGGTRSARRSRSSSARFSPCRARRRRAARPPSSASRWRWTASTRPVASAAGRSSCSSPTTSPSRTWAGARRRSSSSRTRSTPTPAASSPTSAWPACRCTRSTSSST